MFCTCDSLNPASSHPFTACFLKVASLVSNYLGWALLPPAGHSGTSPLCLISGAGSNSGFLGLRTLYLQGEGRLDFAAWNTAIGGAAGGGGTGLQEQQMSRGDIPIIVDACISFVTQHGEWAQIDTELVGGVGEVRVCVCVHAFVHVCEKMIPDAF
jgi:hypothetical protein